MGTPADLIQTRADRRRRARVATGPVHRFPTGSADSLSDLLAEARQLEAARAYLPLREAEAKFPLAAVSHAQFRRMFVTAMMVGAHDLATTWLKLRHATSYQLSVQSFISCAAPDVALFHANGSCARVLFGKHLWNSPALDATLLRWADIHPMFHHFMTSPHRIDGVVAVNLGDAGAYPGLSFCDYRPCFFLIPDAEYMDQGRYAALRDAFRQQGVAWQDRDPIALWRGATTGVPPMGMRWHGLPRIRLCEIARDYPHLIDAGITGVVQIEDPSAGDWLTAAGLTRPPMPITQFQRYRYQIDIDGNTNSWLGLFAKLLTGSPVLKIASERGYRQWYYSRLVPWVNFVPVASDMSDLAEKVAWLIENDETARRIGAAGAEVAGALTEEREVTDAASVIAAAMRTAGSRPMVELAFGANGSPFPGFSARLELATPHGRDDCVLILDVSPVGPSPRHITVFANGEIITRRSISERTTIHCPLLRSVLDLSDNLAIGFLFPDCRPNASQKNPLDNSMSSVTLHGARIAAACCFSGREHPDLVAALLALHAATRTTAAHDLWAGQMPANSAEGARPLDTAHGTRLYADLAMRRVRHGPVTAVPANLFLSEKDGTARLVRIEGDSYGFDVYLRPEPVSARAGSTGTRGTASVARTFKVVPHDDGFGLKAAGLFLCAEAGGEVTLSRRRAGPWERFSNVPVGV